MAQLAGVDLVLPSQIQAWKKALTDGASGVFGNGQDQQATSGAALLPTIQGSSSMNHPIGFQTPCPGGDVIDVYRDLDLGRDGAKGRYRS